MLSHELELDAGDRFDVRRWIDDRHRLERFYLDRGYQRGRTTHETNRLALRRASVIPDSPKEETLVISDDLKAALDRFLKAPQPKKTTAK